MIFVTKHMAKFRGEIRAGNESSSGKDLDSFS